MTAVVVSGNEAGNPYHCPAGTGLTAGRFTDEIGGSCHPLTEQLSEQGLQQRQAALNAELQKDIDSDRRAKLEEELQLVQNEMKKRSSSPSGEGAGIPEGMTPEQAELWEEISSIGPGRPSDLGIVNGSTAEDWLRERYPFLDVALRFGHGARTGVDDWLASLPFDAVGDRMQLDDYERWTDEGDAALFAEALNRLDEFQANFDQFESTFWVDDILVGGEGGATFRGKVLDAILFGGLSPDEVDERFKAEVTDLQDGLALPLSTPSLELFPVKVKETKIGELPDLDGLEKWFDGRREAWDEVKDQQVPRELLAEVLDPDLTRHGGGDPARFWAVGSEPTWGELIEEDHVSTFTALKAEEAGLAPIGFANRRWMAAGNTLLNFQTELWKMENEDDPWIALDHAARVAEIYELLPANLRTTSNFGEKPFPLDRFPFEERDSIREIPKPDFGKLVDMSLAAYEPSPRFSPPTPDEIDLRPAALDGSPRGADMDEVLDTGLTSRALQKAVIAGWLAKDLENRGISVTDEEVSNIIAEWAQSSQSPGSQLNQAIADELIGGAGSFTTQQGGRYPETTTRTSTMDEREYRVRRAILEEMYARTQASLGDDQSSYELMRGASFTFAGTGRVAPVTQAFTEMTLEEFQEGSAVLELEWDRNPMTSWTSAYPIAQQFGRPDSNKSIGIIQIADVPKEAILSTMRTGFGSMIEDEVVVLDHGGATLVEMSWDPETVRRAWPIIRDSTGRSWETDNWDSLEPEQQWQFIQDDLRKELEYA